MSDHPLPIWFVLTSPHRNSSGVRPQSSRIIASLYRFGRRKVTLALLALVAGIYALIHGHTEVLVWLAWGFLPWFVLRMGRQKGEVLRANDWDEKLAKRRQGENLWFPAELVREGIGVHFLFWLKWEFFARYEVLKQEAEYFIIRLWRNENSGTAIVEHAPNGEIREESLLRLFARNVPMLVTVMALLVGCHRFGWRADVLAALFLSLQFYLEARMRRKLRRWARSTQSVEDLPYLDIAFDSSKITLEEARTRLDRSLPQHTDWV